MEKLVTIKVTNHPVQLGIAQSLLESEGIYTFVKDELMSQAYSVANGAVGGAKLQVNEEDAERAIMLLIEGGLARKEDYEPSKSDIRLTKVINKIRAFFGSKDKD